MALSNELISQFAKMSKDNKRESKESTVYGKIVQIDKTKYVQIDGSDRLTPISSTTDALNGERVTVMIKDHKAIVNGNISSPSARTGTVKEIDDRVVAQGNDISAINNNINAQNNNITAIGNAVNAQNNKITAMENNVTAIGNDITAQNNTISQINDKVTSQDNTITALNNDIGIYNSSFQIKNGVVTGIKGIKTDWIKTEDLEADHATITSLDTKYANIDFANIGEAAVEKFYAVSGIIQNLTLETGVVVKELIGVLISGDLIKGNTIQADKLIVRGEDGLYYKLNVDALGETTASADPKYQNGLDGSVIIAKSVTAEKVSVSDLVAFGATIGGFHITGADAETNTPGAIYSGVKSSAANTTAGIYLDSDGQVSFGDSNNFVKFYKDDNNNYKLEISAESMVLGATKRDVERSVSNLGDSISDVGEKLSDATSLWYKVTYDSSASTYTLTEKRISSSDVSDVSVVENAVTTTGEHVYSGKDATNTTIYFSKVQVSSDNLQDSVDDANKEIAEAKSQIQSLGDKVITTVTDSNGETSLEQTSGGWTFNLDAVKKTADNAKDGVDKNTEAIGDPEEKTGLYGQTDELFKKFADQDAYITFKEIGGDPYLILGNSSKFKIQITNQEIQFYDGSTKVAYINDQQLYIEKAIIKNELEIGNNSGFIWKSRDNGNMGLQWFERDDSEITYTIIYDANGGSPTPAKQIKTRGEDLILQSAVQPTKAGYTFMGWSEICNGPVCYKCGWPCNVNRDLVLYAVWESGDVEETTYYTITYDYNNGSGMSGQYSTEAGQPYTIESFTPTRDGYTFAGWGLSSDSTTATYQPGVSYEISGNLYLYAVWVADVTEDGSSFDKAITISLNETVSTTITTTNTDRYYKFVPSTTGTYVFESSGSVDSRIFLYESSDTSTRIGYDDDSGDGNNFKLSKELTAGTIYYVSVSVINNETGTFTFTVTKESGGSTIYTITYDANGGSGAPASQTKTAGETINISSVVPTRDGYTFKGWGLASDGTHVAFKPGASFSTDMDMTLYAIWEANTTSGTYTLQGDDVTFYRVEYDVTNDRTVRTNEVIPVSTISSRSNIQGNAIKATLDNISCFTYTGERVYHAYNKDIQGNTLDEIYFCRVVTGKQIAFYKVTSTGTSADDLEITRTSELISGQIKDLNKIYGPYMINNGSMDLDLTLSSELVTTTAGDIVYIDNTNNEMFCEHLY